MRVRFACEHCDQLLSAGESKIGTEVKCPKCKAATTVPAKEDADVMLAMRKAGRSETNDDSEGQSLGDFAVFDDGSELIYDTGDAWAYEDETPVDRTLVAVSRRVLYMQGALLGVVAVGAFAFGVFVGGFARKPAPRVERSRPCVLTGRIEYRSGPNETVADEGSVVIVVPAGARPDSEKKIGVEGLEPGAPVTDAAHQGVIAIRALGGDYDRVGAGGEFRVQVKRPGDYFVLFLSNHMQRGRLEAPPVEDLAEMGRYFLPHLELLGERKYHWKKEKIDDNRRIDFIFDEGQ